MEALKFGHSIVVRWSPPTNTKGGFYRATFDSWEANRKTSVKLGNDFNDSDRSKLYIEAAQVLADYLNSPPNTEFSFFNVVESIQIASLDPSAWVLIVRMDHVAKES